MNFELLARQLRAFGETERHYLPLLSNASAILMEQLKQINWAGFYLRQGDDLLLGPFQGKAACIRISYGKGVCGTALAEDRTLRISDVHAFPGHIACDAASKAELVIPIHARGRVVAVLDIDSPVPDRFSEADQAGLELFVRTLEETMDMESLPF